MAEREGAETAGRPEQAFALAPWLNGAPLMVNPLAAFAATTAIGLGIASHFAGLMADAMKGVAAEASAKREEEAAVPATATVVTLVPRAPEKTARPARKREPVKTAERKPAAQKPGADDLKAISGIGPKLEQVLNGMGHRRYGDIAAWTAAKAAEIDAELGLDGRIARDGWVEQAKVLAKGRG